MMWTAKSLFHLGTHNKYLSLLAEIVMTSYRCYAIRVGDRWVIIIRVNTTSLCTYNMHYI